MSRPPSTVLGPPSSVTPGAGPRSAPAALLRLLAFFGAVVLCLFGLDLCINAGLRRIPTGSFGVTNRILHGQVNADIIVTGSSRALTHYDPRILQEETGRTAYNIGINGSQTDLQLALLRAYLRHNRRPALVIHNLDLFSFVTTREVYEPARYLPYLREPSLYATLKDINPSTWKCRYLPLYGYAVQDLRFTWLLGLKGFLGWYPREDLQRGFEPRHTPWTGDFEKFKQANPGGVSFDIEPEGIRSLEELVATARAQDIAVLLVYSPEYFEMQALEKNRAAVFAEFERIRSKYGVLLWDYSGSPITRQRDYFYNSQHLNATGASAFSHDLAARIVNDGTLARNSPINSTRKLSQ